MKAKNCYISPMNVLYMKGCIRRKVKRDLRKVIYMYDDRDRTI